MYFVNHADEYLPTVLCYTINEPLSLSLSFYSSIYTGFAIIYNAFVKHGIPTDERPSIYHAAHRTIKRVTVVTTQANIRLSLVSIFHSFERKAFR